MKKLPLLIASILLIGACSDSQETVQSSEPQPMVEYVWMKAGPNFNAVSYTHLTLPTTLNV